ncbi:MAG: hypothetical protein ACYS9X_03065 [Planctomycetota bacterium]|jgi:hypothetical protein
MSPLGICHTCNSGLEPDGTVRLWDGQDYCRSCVEAACPGLSDYAASHEALEDKEEWAPAANIWWCFKLWVVVGLFAGLAIAAFGVLTSETGNVEPGLLLLFAAIWLFILALDVVGELWLGRGLRETICVHSGQVTVTAPHRRKPSEYSLAQCRWLIGRGVSRGTGPPPKGPRLVLQFSDRILGLIPTKRYSTFGSTPETLSIWRGFLTLAGVEPLDPPWWLR